MNRPCPIRRFPLPLVALLSVALSVGSLALGLDSNTPIQPATNFDRLEPKPALAPAPKLWPPGFPWLKPGRFVPTPTVAVGGSTNSQPKFPPPSSNSIAFQETKARAEKGDAEAQSSLGLAYYLGIGVGTNFAEAVKWWLKAAEQGEADAQIDLGVCYQNGQGVPQEYTEAVKWYRKAAEQANEGSQYLLGWCYENGQGVPQDYTEAAQWYRKAAEQGNAAAQDELGQMYALGNGLPLDFAEAVKWFRKAAEQGYAPAQTRLGAAYSNGTAVATNLVEAVKWFGKAAEQGEPYGQYDLGLCYFNGQGVPQDYAEAVKLFRKAAEQGYAAAQSRIGYAYCIGMGVGINFVEAVTWLRKAAEQGDAAAQSNLGWCYYNGEGVKQDYAEAAMWYRKAAEQGDADAQKFLLFCYDALVNSYFFGKGVTHDYAEGMKWCRKAAEQGQAMAEVNLGSGYYRGQGVAQDYAEAVKWWRKAADQGNCTAQYFLGLCFWRGEGAPENDTEAYKWLSLAAAQGFAGSTEQRDSLAQTMSREEIVEGQRRAAAFVARKEAPGDSNSSNLPAQSGVTEGEPKASGTGFFVSEDGFLLTAFHVVADAGRIAVRMKAGTFPATLVKADKANDVALLKVTGRFPALPVAPSRGVKLGESVFTIGFPNIGLQGFAPKLTKGEISSLAGVQDDPRAFQISVPVQPGNSGGPLVNQYGNVVGIVAAQLADIATLETTGSLPQSVNYAVKSSVVNVLLESLPEVSAKLKQPNSKEEKFEDAVKEVQDAIALILVY
ncbi:MAG: trypsin-like peptidase domain-containing protein [Verrucomicrobiota bacterium]